MTTSQTMLIQTKLSSEDNNELCLDNYHHMDKEDMTETMTYRRLVDLGLQDGIAWAMLGGARGP